MTITPFLAVRRSTQLLILLFASQRFAAFKTLFVPHLCNSQSPALCVINSRMSSLKRSFTVADTNSSTGTAGERRLHQRGLKILEILDSYYPNPPIPLDHRNDFTFLVAVVLSAQTTDGKVNEVTKELFDLADSAEKMSKLDIQKVQSIIQPVGLAPKKAQYLVGLSKMIVEKFNNKIPNTYEGLESLPGVGHKTASVIMSQLFGNNSLAVDTHVHRLALRWGLTKEQRNVDKVQIDLCRIFPEHLWNKAHLQMIYFGREYCSAKNHIISECPICSWIHNEDKRPTSPESLASFSPQKRAKGLVYYQDRVNELTKNPSLAMFSSSPAKLSANTFEPEELAAVNEAKENSDSATQSLPVAAFEFKEELEVPPSTGSLIATSTVVRRSPRMIRRSSTK